MSTSRLTYGAHARALLALGLPIVGTLVAGLVLHMSDTVMLGKYGIDELAAVVIGGQIWFILFIAGSGIGAALSGPIASAMAQKDEVTVRRLVRMGLWLTVGYAMLVTPIYFFAEPLLLALGQQPQIAALAGDYVQIVGFSVYPVLLQNLIRTYLAALEKTAFVLIASIIAVIFHIFLNWVLIFGAFGIPAMGVKGAAISSLLTDTALMLMVLAYALRTFPEHRLLHRFWKPDWEILKRVFFLGVPVSLQLVAEVGLFAFAAVLMGRVSAEMLAAHGIALQLAGITFLIQLGVAQAATVRTGQAFGARNDRLLRDGALVGVFMSILFAVFTMAVFLIFREGLVSLFLSPDDPDTPAVIAAGATLLILAAIFQIFDGGQAMAMNLLRGVHDTRIPMVIAIVSYWLVGVPAAWWLGSPDRFGGVGVWSGLVIGLACAWVGLSVRFWRRNWVVAVGPAGHSMAN